MSAWKRGTKHFVGKTRTEHKCENCSGIIPKGSQAWYRNLFTGKRGYEHKGCPEQQIQLMIDKNRRACAKRNIERRAKKINNSLDDSD